MNHSLLTPVQTRLIASLLTPVQTRLIASLLTPNYKNMIDQEQVHKVANLARLELTPEEEEQFTTQLGNILDYIEQLNELDVSNVPPTTRAIDVSNITREDELQPYPDRESILNSAPEQEGEFFKVPKILNAE